MNKLKILISAVIAALTILSSLPTYASDNEAWYIGGSVGQADAANYCDKVSNSFACNHTSASSRVFFGFQANRWFGIELGYINLGKSKMDGSGTAVGTLCNPVCTTASGTYAYTDTVKGTGFQFAGIGNVPLGKGLFFIGKAGWLHWTMSGSSTLTTAGIPAGYISFPTSGNFGDHNPFSNNASDSGDSPMLGLGLKYEISEQFTVRGEFELAPQIGSKATGKYDYRIYSTSLIYKF